MENENIVATGIYYRQSQNISASRLAFRRAIALPDYEQNDDNGMREIYGLENDGALHQDCTFLLFVLFAVLPVRFVDCVGMSCDAD